MSTVRDVLKGKGSEVITLAADATVLAAARLMNERGIGCVLITNGGALEGIFTERDVLRRVVAEGRDPATTPLRDVMTTKLMTCSPQATLDDCASVMTSGGFRHLPVLGSEGLCGVVSSRDVLASCVAEQQTTIQHLSSYVYDLR